MFIEVTNRFSEDEVMLINSDYIVKITPKKLKYGNTFKTVACIVLNREYPGIMSEEIETNETFLTVVGRLKEVIHKEAI